MSSVPSDPVRTVTTQAEFDQAIADEIRDIEIASPPGVWILVKTTGSSKVHVTNSSVVHAYNSSVVHAYDSSVVYAYDSTTVRAHDSKVVVRAHDSKVVVQRDPGEEFYDE